MCILRQTSVQLPSFSKDIKLTFLADTNIVNPDVNDVDEKAIYQLQTIEINGKRYSVFFDSGCGDFVSRYEAIKRLGTNARQELPGPIKIGGVGGINTESQHGIYSVKIPLFIKQTQSCQEFV